MSQSRTPIPVTKRIQMLRELYKACPYATESRPHYYSGDRWISLAFLRGWENYAREATTLLRRCRAEAQELLEADPVIQEGELLVGQLDLHAYTPEEQAEFDRLYRSFSSAAPRTPGAKDHTCLDYEKLLRVGVNGLLAEIRENRKRLALTTAEDLETNLAKDEFYAGCEIELSALLDLAARYSQRAREMAQEAEGQRQAELYQIAETLQHVPAEGARSFREALQSMHFYTYNLCGLYPMGHPDQYLLPYYEKSIADGTVTPEEAQELIDQACLLMTTYIFSRASCGFMVGGRDSAGKAVENDLTWMFLTALDHIRMPDPSGALAVTEETSDELLQYAAEILSRGTTHPALYNDRAISDELLRQGYDAEDVHNFIHSTCTEISICGKSRMATTSPYHNIVRVLHQVLAEREDWRSSDEIMARFEKVVREAVIAGNRRVNYARMEVLRLGAEPLRTSCLIDNCLASGKSIAQGGAKYNRNLPTFVGFGNVCDTLLAVEHLVFREKRITLPEWMEALRVNYVGYEELRQYILRSVPHYGNDEEEVLALSKRLADLLARACEGEYTLGGEAIVPGMFSYMVHSMDGAGMGATADGRLAGESLSDGAGPVQGRDVSGPTALIRSLNCWNPARFLGGVVVNLKFSKTSMNEHTVRQLVPLIRAFMSSGGVELQINVVDNQTLIDAMEHPERYGDLMVRIGGYSDYFVKLDTVAQLDIINRTTQQ